MQKVEVNLMNAPSGNVITILEGKALEQKYPEKFRITGDIQSVGNFLKQRYAEGVTGKAQQFVDKETVVVVADEGNMAITLLLNPNDFFATEITGKLEFTPELLQWNINPQNAASFNRKDVVTLLKFNRRFFDDSDRFDKVLAAFQAFKISTQTDLAAGSDTRGNKSASIEKKVLSDNSMPTDFILILPVFKGQKVEKFRVEICLDTTDQSAKFWFESPELHELIEVRKKEIFATQLAKCTDFVIINK